MPALAQRMLMGPKWDTAWAMDEVMAGSELMSP
jgi:hypothetical protein